MKAWIGMGLKNYARIISICSLFVSVKYCNAQGANRVDNWINNTTEGFVRMPVDHFSVIKPDQFDLKYGFSLKSFFKSIANISKWFLRGVQKSISQKLLFSFLFIFLFFDFRGRKFMRVKQKTVSSSSKKFFLFRQKLIFFVLFFLLIKIGWTRRGEQPTKQF